MTSDAPPRASQPDPTLPDGLVAIVKRDCPTCVLVAPVLADLAGRTKLTVFTQDDPDFPEGVDAVDDRELVVSYHHDIEAVPTLLRIEGGREVERTAKPNCCRMYCRSGSLASRACASSSRYSA